MNRKDFSNAVSELDEKYYSEAVNYKKKKGGVVKWIAAAAACFCIVVFGFMIAANNKKPAVNPSNPNVSTDIAQSIKFNGGIYFVCGPGEVEILKECGLPNTLDSFLAGKHISYLRFEENGSEYVLQDEKEGSGGEFFEYAPQPNKNVYIVLYGEKYYAAIRHDENGYHGVK